MNIFNWRPKTITLDAQKPILMGRRNPVTGHSVLMIEADAESHRKFIAEFVATLKPEGMIEIQLAQRLAQDTWRINRIHAAMVQALTFRDDPRLFSYLATYEQKLTKNFHLNFNLLLKLQSLRQPVLAKEKVMTASA